MTDRRTFLRRAVAATVGAAALPSTQHATAAQPSSASPYGNIDDGRQGDAHGILLPDGFSSRIVAMSGESVGATGHVWPIFPDGAATFADGTGGWFHAVNSEARDGAAGGVSVIHFASDGSIVDAYSVLSDTFVNCAGGPTPWGTWLSCEEFPAGRVWECDPTQPGQGVVRPALGSFQHEAVAVDPVREQLYLTEDTGDGRLYRFTPDSYPNLDSGVLEAAVVGADSSISWAPIPDPTGSDKPTRLQAPESTPFAGGEGIWYYQDTIYFTSKGDHSVWEIDIPSSRLRRIWQGNPGGSAAGILTHVDNIVVEEGTGDLIVAEDGGNMELVLITPQGDVAPFLRLVDPGHRNSEMTGPVFNPDGTRLYFSSQRGPNSSGQTIGVTYEISGPFRGARPTSGTTTEPTATPAPEPTPEPTVATERPSPTPRPVPTEDPAAVAQPPATEVPLATEPTATATPAPLAPTATPEPTVIAAVEPTAEPTATATAEPTPTPTETLEGALVINEADDAGGGNTTTIALATGGVAVAGLAAAMAFRSRRVADVAAAGSAHAPTPGARSVDSAVAPDDAAAGAGADYTWSEAPDVGDEAWPDVDGPRVEPAPDVTDDWPEI